MSAAPNAAVTARALAAQVIARVLLDRRYLDAAIDELRRTRAVPAIDWSLVQELAYGTLRWYHQLGGIATLFLARPLKAKDTDVKALLLVGLYQLRHMRVPEYAAVDATVAAAEILGKPWAKGVLNACLRAYLREALRVEQAVAATAEWHYSHPAWLIAAIRRDYPEQWERVLDGNNERPPMTLRVNTARLPRTEYQARLAASGLAAHPHPMVESALVLEQAVPVERLPGFREGQVSVQDAGAQLAASGSGRDREPVCWMPARHRAARPRTSWSARRRCRNSRPSTRTPNGWNACAPT